MPLRRAIALMTAALNMPFGYTLAVWSSGMIAIDHFDTPHLPGVFAFLFGAIAAYLTLALSSARYLGPSTPVQMQRATLINFFAIVAAAAVTVVVRLIPWPVVGFFVAGFTGTLTYIICLAGLVWLVAWRTARLHQPADASQRSEEERRGPD